MAVPPTIFIVCSDRNRNGKTLLARVLTDHLLMRERDPFCFDLAAPDGALRAYFPGRTALIDFTQEQGRARLFEMIMAGAGRDHVIDATSAHVAQLCELATRSGFSASARDQGFRICAIYIVDRDEKSLKGAVAVEDALQPDLFVPVINRFVGTSLPDGVPGPLLVMEKTDADLHAIVSNRRFSLRAFMLGEEAGVPARLRPNLKTFMHTLTAGLRDLEPALSLKALRMAEL